MFEVIQLSQHIWDKCAPVSLYRVTKAIIDMKVIWNTIVPGDLLIFNGVWCTNIP